MIKHICMFKMKEQGREESIKTFLERAESLKSIKQIRKFEAVRNAQEAPAANYDVSLIFDFDSIEDLNAYQISETHQNFVAFVKTVREERACIDYEF